jgi:hypothetical protein
VAQAGDDLAETLRKRRAMVDEDIQELLTTMPEEPLVSKAEIERLRKSRREIGLVPDWSTKVINAFDPPKIVPGLDGVAQATIELTTELVAPLTAASVTEVSRRVQKLSQTQEAQELNDYLERVCELLRFFYNAKLNDKDKRAKLILNLNKIKNEINNTFNPKSQFPNDWVGTISMINGMITNAEIVNANLG